MIVRDHDAEDIDDAEDGGWGDDPDDDATSPCPACGRSIYDDSERCPDCGQYLSREEAPFRKPWWVVAGVLACLGVVSWWILHP